MVSTAPLTQDQYEAFLRQGQVKHALKTALACCLAAALSYRFHLSSGQLAPLFAFLLMTLGMPSPRLNWLLTLLAIVVSAILSALIMLTFRDAFFLYLAVTLLWIFFCTLFNARLPLPATLGAMVSALGVFVFFQGTVGDALNFFVAYAINWFVGGASVTVVDTLLWPFTTRKVFVKRLAAVYTHFEQQFRQAAKSLHSGEAPAALASQEEWAPFRPLRQMLAPELRRAPGTSNPFAQMILACRAVNLRLWYFNRTIIPTLTAASNTETRQELASVLERCADVLNSLFECAIKRRRSPPFDAGLLSEANSVRWSADSTHDLTNHGIHVSILRRLVQDLHAVTNCHNALVTGFQSGLAGEWIAQGPATTGKPLYDVQSVRSGTKLVVILILLIVEEAWLRFPGGSQVAFFATFFASTGNLGRQNKTDLVGLSGLLSGFAYGVVAAYLTSRIPHIPLMLALVFLGQFVASLTFQRLPRYGAAGLQAGLAIPFAYLATTGPEWGSFTDVRTRFAGLVVAGFTAVVVHAYLWPVLPIRALRGSIAAALRATAASLTQLFGPARSNWQGAPTDLGQTLARAPDLLDDARYLPGPEQPDPAYDGILRALQEIDANLEYIHFLIGLETDHPLRQRFFRVIGDYMQQAQGVLEMVARQFQQSPHGAAAIEAVHWEPNVSRRWELASGDVSSLVVDQNVDLWRPAVIARCLDHVARAAEKISIIAREINLRCAGS